MSLNQNSHFSRAPHVNIPRSRIDMSHGVTQTMNAGLLTPFEIKEIIPGDTFEVDTSILARMQTLIAPIFGNVYLDVYYFYVPNRLLWKHWENFCGQSDEPWFDDTEYTVPQISVDIAPGAQERDNGVRKGTLADYLGMPLANPIEEGDPNTPIMRKWDHTPFRAYVKIWNDWFRNENTQALAAFNMEDNDVVMNPEGEAFYGGKLLPVQKYRDYFTSSLMQPQRGEAVSMGFSGLIPVNTQSYYPSIQSQSVRFSASGAQMNKSYDVKFNTLTDANNFGYLMYDSAESAEPSAEFNLNQRWAVDTANIQSFSINDLRNAFSMQRYLEALARSGNRYIELLSGIYGVDAGDARLQRSEFLGGNRIAINFNQVLQQSETQTTPLGNLGAYSLTTDSQSSFTKSFVEHGWLLGLCCIRYDHSYQNGYERFWNHKDFEDYANPYFNFVGEQPVYNFEIYADGSSADNEVFGYQEQYAWYRYANNRIAGEMRSNYAQTLDYWHLGDDYTSRPYLDDEWTIENGATLDRAIAVSQRVQDQFLVDFWLTEWATRPLPLYSVPGLDIL